MNGILNGLLEKSRIVEKLTMEIIYYKNEDSITCGMLFSRKISTKVNLPH